MCLSVSEPVEKKTEQLQHGRVRGCNCTIAAASAIVASASVTAATSATTSAAATTAAATTAAVDRLGAGVVRLGLGHLVTNAGLVWSYGRQEVSLLAWLFTK